MGRTSKTTGQLCVIGLLAMGVAACSDGTYNAGDLTVAPGEEKPEPQAPAGNIIADDVFATANSTASFLGQATFGPRPQEVQALVGTSVSDWFTAEVAKPVTSPLEWTRHYRQMVLGTEDDFNWVETQADTMAFWKLAIEGDDQLRQRVAFALSEIFVVSQASSDTLSNHPEAVGYFHDILVRNAFGNYRDLIEDITWSPAMGFFLTYEGNQKADPETGRMPDENYAREILQLFSLGVVPLRPDGSVIDNGGDLYTNEDIKGLAKVFTGLNPNWAIYDSEGANAVLSQPMVVYEWDHSENPKTFLDAYIPANVAAEASISIALDTIAEHPNVSPFIARQLIQRLVTSHPEPDYVERVAIAFERGEYRLPNGAIVGDSRRGDLAATVAAVLFDNEARNDINRDGNRFGKIREPIIRFTNWARAFNVGTITPEYVVYIWNTSNPDALGQQAFGAPSVFNFFRPGYIAPGTLTGAAEMTVPELQITNATTIPGYVNFLEFFVREWIKNVDPASMQELFDSEGIDLDAALQNTSFVPDYTTERALANDAAALVDHLDGLLTYGTMTTETRELIIEAIEQYVIVPDADWDPVGLRVYLAILMIMSSPDYLVQR